MPRPFTVFRSLGAFALMLSMVAGLFAFSAPAPVAAQTEPNELPVQVLALLCDSGPGAPGTAVVSIQQVAGVGGESLDACDGVAVAGVVDGSVQFLPGGEAVTIVGGSGSGGTVNAPIGGTVTANFAGEGATGSGSSSVISADADALIVTITVFVAAPPPSPSPSPTPVTGIRIIKVGDVTTGDFLVQGEGVNLQVNVVSSRIVPLEAGASVTVTEINVPEGCTPSPAVAGPITVQSGVVTDVVVTNNCVAVSPSPDVEVSPSPDVEVSPSPDVEVSPSPDVEVSPSPVVSPSPTVGEVREDFVQITAQICATNNQDLLDDQFAYRFDGFLDADTALECRLATEGEVAFDSFFFLGDSEEVLTLGAPTDANGVAFVDGITSPGFFVAFGTPLDLAGIGPFSTADGSFAIFATLFVPKDIDVSPSPIVTPSPIVSPSPEPVETGFLVVTSLFCDVKGKGAEFIVGDPEFLLTDTGDGLTAADHKKYGDNCELLTGALYDVFPFGDDTGEPLFIDDVNESGVIVVELPATTGMDSHLIIEQNTGDEFGAFFDIEDGAVTSIVVIYYPPKDVPTAAPTAKPTAGPTAGPTAAPTAAPTTPGGGQASPGGSTGGATKLPDTGAGSITGDSQTSMLLMLAMLTAGLGAAGYGLRRRAA